MNSNTHLGQAAEREGDLQTIIHRITSYSAEVEIAAAELRARADRIVGFAPEPSGKSDAMPRPDGNGMIYEMHSALDSLSDNLGTLHAQIQRYGTLA